MARLLLLNALYNFTSLTNALGDEKSLQNRYSQNTANIVFSVKLLIPQMVELK